MVEFGIDWNEMLMWIGRVGGRSGCEHVFEDVGAVVWDVSFWCTGNPPNRHLKHNGRRKADSG